MCEDDALDIARGFAQAGNIGKDLLLTARDACINEGKAVSIEDYLLGSIEQNKSEFGTSKLKGVVKDEQGNLMFDLASTEGRKVLFEKVQAELKERKLGPEKYEEVRDELIAAGVSK